jgi:hypothetical protein
MSLLRGGASALNQAVFRDSVFRFEKAAQYFASARPEQGKVKTNFID